MTEWDSQFNLHLLSRCGSTFEWDSQFDVSLPSQCGSTFEWDSQFDVCLPFQCGSTHYCLGRAVPEIHFASLCNVMQPVNSQSSSSAFSSYNCQESPYSFLQMWPIFVLETVKGAGIAQSAVCWAHCPAWCSCMGLILLWASSRGDFPLELT